MARTPPTMTAVRRVARFARLLASVALIALLALTAAPAPHAGAQTNNGGANRFGSCLAAQKQGDLLLLFDQSSSLQQSDPGAERVKAANPLLQTLGRYADRVGANLDVAVAGFADTYSPEKDWTKLSAASADPTAAALADMANKNTGIDTDYWLALDGARQQLAARGADRCQAIAWFSDGKIDFTPRPVSKPYAEGLTLDAPGAVDQARTQAIDSICRPGGLADQVRSADIITLGIGLGANASPTDFDVMSAIATGKGLNGMSCGQITDPVPGDFYPVSNIDDMLFAFDALNPEPGVTSQGPVCQLQVCPEARHNFVLDRSIKSVNILGSGGQPGVVPYLVAPGGQTLELPKKDGPTNADIAGVPVQYEWQSESAQTISIQNTGGAPWAGQWAIVYVDTTGQHPDAVSKVNIHITTDIFPALVGADAVSWRSGQVLDGLSFGLADGQGTPIAAADLAGTAALTATLVPDGAAPIPLLDAAPKADISKPVDADLTNINPGPAVLRMSLVITTAPATDPAGAQIAPGTQLSPQDVELPVQILPKLGLPTPGQRIDFGSVQAAQGANASLAITGPGCVWIADADNAQIIAAPDGIGTPRITSANNSAQSCLKVQAGQDAQLPVTLRTDADGHGGLNGTVPVHVAALDNPDDAQVVEVPFIASLTKPLNTTNFVLVLIAALLAGPGIPLALLYASKWWVSKIPDTPLLAERIPVEVRDDEVLRDGQPFAMADTDLVHPVPGLAGGARTLQVHGATLAVTLGRNPFGAGHVTVTTDGMVSAGSQIPGNDATGLRAVLPLAVHNTWVVLHDPAGPVDAAEVLLLVGGRTDTAARENLYEQIGRRLPELLGALRLRAISAGLAVSRDTAADPGSPFGEHTAAAGYDPFSADARAAHTAVSSGPAALSTGPADDDPFAPAPVAGGAPAHRAAAAPTRSPAPQPPPPLHADPEETTLGVPAADAEETTLGVPAADPEETTLPAPVTYQPGRRFDTGPQHTAPPDPPPHPGPPPPPGPAWPQDPPPAQRPVRHDPEPFDPFGEGS